LALGLALDFAAVAVGVSAALAFAPELPPPPVAANAPPVIAKTSATKATTVVGFRCLRIARDIRSFLSLADLTIYYFLAL
jgi:hypothetical protein